MAKNKLIVPGVTFISGILLWLIFYFWQNEIIGTGEWSLWIKIIFCFLIAGIFIYSAVTCRRATGGRKGNTVRTVVLIIMSVLTFFQIGIYPSLILALGAIIIGIIAYKGNDFVEDQI